MIFFRIVFIVLLLMLPCLADKAINTDLGHISDLKYILENSSVIKDLNKKIQEISKKVDGMLQASPCLAKKEADKIINNDLGHIRIVDLKYILEHSLVIKDLNKKIQEISKKIDESMSDSQLELQKNEAQLVELRSKSPADYAKQKALFDKKVVRAQQSLQEQRRKLTKTYSDGFAEVTNYTIEIVKNICKKEGCSIVLPSSQILYAQDYLNITSQVMEELNKKVQSINIKF